MRKLLLIVVSSLVVVLSSCGGDDTTEEGFSVIPPEDMSEIIYDMNLIEAAYRGRMHNDTLAEEQMLARMQHTLEKRSISREQFLSNYQYYLNDPEELGEIYNDALARLSTHLSKVEESEK